MFTVSGKSRSEVAVTEPQSSRLPQSEIPCRHMQRPKPVAAINKIFCNDMHDSLLVLQSSTDFEELCLQKRSPIALSNR